MRATTLSHSHLHKSLLLCVTGLLRGESHSEGNNLSLSSPSHAIVVWEGLVILL